MITLSYALCIGVHGITVYTALWWDILLEFFSEFRPYNSIIKKHNWNNSLQILPHLTRISSIDLSISQLFNIWHPIWHFYPQCSHQHHLDFCRFLQKYILHYEQITLLPVTSSNFYHTLKLLHISPSTCWSSNQEPTVSDSSLHVHLIDSE